MSTVNDNVRYAESHEWVSVEGDIATIGISDYAQHALGDIVYVDMPEEGDQIEAGEAFGAVESVKAASDLISPVSGEVVEVNSDLEDSPELINKDAFANWILKVRMSNPGEVDALMDAAAYAKLCENE
jgi:glycine cleavage system H protein